MVASKVETTLRNDKGKNAIMRFFSTVQYFFKYV